MRSENQIFSERIKFIIETAKRRPLSLSPRNKTLCSPVSDEK